VVLAHAVETDVADEDHLVVFLGEEFAEVDARVVVQAGEELDVKGVAVVIEASQYCMTIRGVRKPGSVCVTSAMKGLFRSNLSSRSEVMTLIYGDRR
jgi:GTP cyclohydrolase I